VSSSWLQVSIRTDPAAFDAVSNFLIERGSPGVVVTKKAVQGYFPNPKSYAAVKKDVQRFLEKIKPFYSLRDRPSFQWQIITDENWNSSWRRFIKPQRIGNSLWVTPPWLQPPRSNRRQVITIEPGLAFGTGTHATTRLCLHFIVKVTRSAPGDRFTALDVGTGSGILAIALAKLGAKKIWAVDNDPVALKVAAENLSINGVDKFVHLSSTKLSRIRQVFFVVVANLTAPLLEKLAAPLAKRVAPGGYLILSGLLHYQEDTVSERFAPLGFRIVQCKREKEWSTLLLRRK